MSRLHRLHRPLSPLAARLALGLLAALVLTGAAVPLAPPAEAFYVPVCYPESLYPLKIKCV